MERVTNSGLMTHVALYLVPLFRRCVVGPLLHSQQCSAYSWRCARRQESNPNCLCTLWLCCFVAPYPLSILFSVGFLVEIQVNGAGVGLPSDWPGFGLQSLEWSQEKPLNMTRYDQFSDEFDFGHTGNRVLLLRVVPVLLFVLTRVAQQHLLIITSLPPELCSLCASV